MDRWTTQLQRQTEKGRFIQEYINRVGKKPPSIQQFSPIPSESGPEIEKKGEDLSQKTKNKNKMFRDSLSTV